MDKKYYKRFNEIYEFLKNAEKDVSEIKNESTTKRDMLAKKISSLESKDHLSERQEEVLDDYQYELDNLEDDLDQLEDFVEHVTDAMGNICFELGLLQKHTVYLENKLEQMKNSNV